MIIIRRADYMNYLSIYEWNNVIFIKKQAVEIYRLND